MYLCLIFLSLISFKFADLLKHSFYKTYFDIACLTYLFTFNLNCRYFIRDFITWKHLPSIIMNYTIYLSTQISNLFLIQGYQLNMIKRTDFKPMQWWNPYVGDCFFIVESLLVFYCQHCFDNIMVSTYKTLNKTQTWIFVCLLYVSEYEVFIF